MGGSVKRMEMKMSMKERRWCEKEKGRRIGEGEKVTIKLLHSFSIMVKEASTGNVIPKCEMCV